MRAVIQRVVSSSVKVSEQEIASIGSGLLVLIGIVETDTQDDISWLCRKIANLRIFNDEDGVMNKSIMQVEGSVLLISQFTLHASTKKGNRPSYIRAAKPEVAIGIYEEFVSELSMILDKDVETGQFGADMKVSLINDGPVTIIIDTDHKE